MNPPPEIPQPNQPQVTTVDLLKAIRKLASNMNKVQNQLTRQDRQLQDQDKQQNRNLNILHTELLENMLTSFSSEKSEEHEQDSHQTWSECQTQSEWLSDSEKFTGKRIDLHFFLTQLWNKLEENADQYSTKSERVQYAVSQMSEDTVITIDIFFSDTVAVFVTILEASYGDPNWQATAQQRLN